MRRSVYLQPVFEDEGLIEDIRERYDGLYGVVKPHITLVFPFEGALEGAEVAAHVRRVVGEVRPFQLEMAGLSGHSGEDGSFLFLDVKRGAGEIRALSGALYGGLLAAYRPAWYKGYTPHITLGRFADAAALEAATERIGSFPYHFSTTVDAVHVEVIGADGSSHLESNVALATPLDALPSIGQSMKRMLLACGIMDAESLRACGSKEAYFRLRTAFPHMNASYIYALECALQGRPYGTLDAQVKQDLKAFAEGLK